MRLFTRDVCATSAEISWCIPHGGAGAYAVDIEEKDGSWRTMSSTIVKTIIRKGNLLPGSTHRFRARYKREDEKWSENGEVLEVTTLTEEEERNRAGPVTLSEALRTALIVQWDSIPGAATYQVEMMAFSRNLASIDVRVLPLLKGTAVKKGYLDRQHAYTFRVRGMDSKGQAVTAYSAVSKDMGVSTWEPQQLLGNQLIGTNGQTVETSGALAGKVVILYFSAHWCGPCRQFTPRLRAFYDRLKNAGEPVEVVFCSADQDETEFRSYFSEMGWKAIPFSSSHRQNVQQYYQVNGIPKAIVLHPANGKTIEDRVTQMDLSSTAVFDQWKKACHV